MSKSLVAMFIMLCSLGVQAAQINLITGQRTNPLWDPQSRQYVTVTCSENPYGPGPGYPPPPSSGPVAMPCTAYHYDQAVTCTPRQSSQNGSQLVYTCLVSSSCSHGNVGHYLFSSVFNMQTNQWVSQCTQSYSQDGC